MRNPLQTIVVDVGHLWVEVLQKRFHSAVQNPQYLLRLVKKLSKRLLEGYTCLFVTFFFHKTRCQLLMRCALTLAIVEDEVVCESQPLGVRCVDSKPITFSSLRKINRHRMQSGKFYEY